MRTRRAWLLSLVLLLILVPVALVACGAPTGNSTVDVTSEQDVDVSQELDRVVVGHIPIAIYAPFFIAEAKGYFEEEGIEVELKRLEGGADMLIQTAAGNFDVGAGGAGAAFFNAVHSGIGVQLVAPLHSERPPMVTPLVVSEAAYAEGLRSVGDLVGETVAVNAFGASTEYWLYGALRSGGVAYEDVNVVAIPFQDIPAALEQGSIKAAMLGEPFATFAEQQGIARRLADDFFDGDQATVVYFNADFAEQRADVAQRFMNAYLRASRDLYNNYHSLENLQILSEYTGLDIEVLEAMAMPIHTTDGYVSIENLNNQQLFFMAQGQLDYDEPLDLSEVVNPTFASNAAASLDERGL